MTRAPAHRARAFPPIVATSLCAVALVAGARSLDAQSLRGSPASLDLQNQIAHEHQFTFIDTGERVRYFAEKGWLVRVRPDRDLTLHAVSFPYARPDVAVFVKRLAEQYRAACGEQLVVTSLTRPTTRQPRNASERSVHPTGMAVDLRYSHNRACRSWLEDTLLGLEKGRIVEATRERYPAHYHVAVFPGRYREYVAGLTDRQATRVAARVSGTSALTKEKYKVRSGDSLWTIARSHGLTVDQVKALNDISDNRIYAGQLLELPTGL